jgi:hypothetical protein
MHPGKNNRHGRCKLGTWKYRKIVAKCAGDEEAIPIITLLDRNMATVFGRIAISAIFLLGFLYNFLYGFYIQVLRCFEFLRTIFVRTVLE